MSKRIEYAAIGFFTGIAMMLIAWMATGVAPTMELMVVYGALGVGLADAIHSLRSNKAE